jgi:hypothetical protein
VGRTELGAGPGERNTGAGGAVESGDTQRNDANADAIPFLLFFHPGGS